MADAEARTSEGRPTVGQKLDAAIDATSGKITQVAHTMKDQIEHGREKVESGYAKTRETLAELKSKNVGDIVQSTKEFAKEHPGTTLLAGIAVGFLVGYFVKRRD